MSGQYPTGFNNPANFGNQMNNPMRNQQMNMNMNMGMPNQMGMMNNQMNFNQPGLMQQPQPSQTPQSQPMQSPNIGLGTTGLSHGSEMGAHVSPQHQMQPQVGQQQQSMCLDTPTASNPGSVSNMIRSLVNPPGTVQSQPQANQQQQQQQKEFNIVSLCRFGQETVQDISRWRQTKYRRTICNIHCCTCSRFQEVFAALKSVQPPNINNNPMQNATEKKVTEQFRTIRLLFKRLRLLFDKCNDSCQQGKTIRSQSM